MFYVLIVAMIAAILFFVHYIRAMQGLVDDVFIGEGDE